MSTDSPLVRQWLLVKVLSSRRLGATVQELSEEMTVSVKTIRRDLNTLKAAGFPLDEQVGQFNRKSWRLDPQWAKAELSFTFDEALALYLGKRFLEPLAGTLFWEAAQRAFRKVRASLGAPVLKYLDKIGGAIHQTTQGTSDYARRSEILDELLIGIEDRRATFITYQSARATEPVTYDVYPYGITFHRGSLYLIGYAPRHEQLRHWKIDRVEDAEVTEVRFQRPAGFDLRRHFDGSFGVYHGTDRVRIVVRFDREVARYVAESRWHASQQLVSQPDGALIAEFDLSSTVEIRSWLLSFGRHAEVLEPQTLRDEIRQEAQAMADQYSRRSTSLNNRAVGRGRSAHGDADSGPTTKRTEATREH